MKLQISLFVIFFFSLTTFSWASEEVMVEDAIEASEEIVDLDETILEESVDADQKKTPADVATEEKTEESVPEATTEEAPVQTGPFIDFFENLDTKISTYLF